MATIICESCGTENPDSVKFCKQCGARLAAAPAPAMAASTVYSTPPGAAANPFEKRYGALRGIAALCKTLAVIFAILSLLGGIGYGFFFGDMIGARMTGAFIGLILAFISATITYLFWRVIGESISVMLDIEENTRRSAALLEQQLK